jgi:hypothetical protein
MTPKEIRKQLKNVTQAMLKEAAVEEIVKEVERRALPIIKERLDIIDSRMKDIQGYFLRHSVQAAKIAEENKPQQTEAKKE